MFKNSNYFLTIVEEGNLSRAAEKLYISQPALSKYLRRLEKRLNVELFDHHSSPLKLTAAGRHYLTYVNQVTALEKRFLAELSQFQKEYRDELNIGFSPFRGSRILPRILPAFTRQYPFVTLKVTENKSQILLSDLSKGLIDFCLAYYIDQEDYSQFTYVVIAEEKILIAANRDHPIIKKLICEKGSFRPGAYPHMDLNLLRGETFTLTTPGQSIPLLTDKLFADYHFRPKKEIHFSDAATNLQLVSNSGYFTFVPEAIVGSEIAPDNVVFFTVGEPALHWSVAVFCPKAAYISPPMRCFIQLLKDYYQTPNCI